MLRSYRDLEVWKKAVSFCSSIYAATRTFPGDERFGLTSQIRRAAVSISCNIAEGYGRKTRGEYIQFLYIANGSICEIETLLLLSKNLGFLSTKDHERLHDEWGHIERMLKGLINSLKQSRSSS